MSRVRVPSVLVHVAALCCSSMVQQHAPWSLPLQSHNVAVLNFILANSFC